MMNPLYAVLLGALVFALTTWGTLLRWREDEYFRPPRVLMATVLIVFTIAGVAAYYTWNYNNIYGVVHYVVVLASSVFYLVGYGYDKVQSKWPALFFLAPFIVLVVSIPVAIFPQLVMETTTKVVEPPIEISTDTIIESFDRIKEALDTAESQLSTESRKIDILTTTLIREIEDSNNELSNIRTELQSVRKELAHYRELASMTEEQAGAVIIAMKGQQYVGYLVGFGGGILIGGMFFLIQRLTSRNL